ncbi:Gfo/Idh/MocA family oxidoreductase [bacterium]|nr:Gfo/Idh/MocA family oxidoreductase [bacterium]
MKRKHSAAVIGCGRMGAFTSESVTRYAPSCWFPLSHAEAIKSHSRLSLAAMCDLDPDILERAVNKYQVENHYCDPGVLLEAERPALVGIATRTIGRASLIEQAAAVGTRAIHAEKPLCNSVAELQSLRALLAQDDFFFTWGAIRRFFGIYRKARELADSGHYGPLREIRVNHGSGPLYWTHPHSIDLLLFGAGERRLDGVQARLSEVVTDCDPVRIDSDPRIVAASLYFDDGVVGHITQALGADFILSCAEAEIVVRADGACLELYGAGEGVYPIARPLEVEEMQTGCGTRGPVSQLVACLEGDNTAMTANARIKRDIIAAQQIAFAMVQSHLEGARIVDPMEVDPNMVILAKTGGRHA